ncbi:hypothetical protein BCV69DRAFT_217569 [Microstroma glucosiphilum]|uniref:Uncharacterized protein n=1 Tax=Pseudomicrostroma glucosiphilum TaxID=1684307 RepID=A0A316U6G1_9BASI|nr:hypothetical protein BCV69DRAFT_217569 [Pseudomicrostroma glucosiphilum]PWN20051.1 hypothetical protein BCV69DRAFT_217569 [Pseudomicrostroma glucosiphilum]
MCVGPCCVGVCDRSCLPFRVCEAKRALRSRSLTLGPSPSSDCRPQLIPPGRHPFIPSPLIHTSSSPPSVSVIPRALKATPSSSAPRTRLPRDLFFWTLFAPREVPPPLPLRLATPTAPLFSRPAVPTGELSLPLRRPQAG